MVQVARENAGHPVKFDFQINNKYFLLVKVCLKYCMGHTYTKKLLVYPKIKCECSVYLLLNLGTLPQWNFGRVLGIFEKDWVKEFSRITLRNINESLSNSQWFNLG